jgi:hypothetical protein
MRCVSCRPAPSRADIHIALIGIKGRSSGSGSAAPIGADINWKKLGASDRSKRFERLITMTAGSRARALSTPAGARRQVVIPEQDMLLHRTVVPFCPGSSGMGLAAGMGHAVLREPGAELGRHVRPPIVAQHARPVPDVHAVQTRVAQRHRESVRDNRLRSWWYTAPGHNIAREV